MTDDKRDLRILIALIVAALGVGAAIFGVVRGLSATGPGRGVRLQIAIAPPLDPTVVALATRVVTERCDDMMGPSRVVNGGDRVVVELGVEDPELVTPLVWGIERHPTLEVRGPDGTTVLTGAGIAGAAVSGGGVKIDLRAPVSVASGAKLMFVLDGKVKAEVPVDHVAPTDLHVQTTGATEDDAIEAATELTAAIEAGAAPALHVTERTPFSRATGFLPRAWPFFAVCAVMLLAAAFIARKRR